MSDRVNKFCSSLQTKLNDLDGRMKSLKSWSQTYEVIEGFSQSLKGKQLVGV